MRFLCTHNQRPPNAIFDFRKIPNKYMVIEILLFFLQMLGNNCLY